MIEHHCFIYQKLDEIFIHVIILHIKGLLLRNYDT